MAHLTLHNVGVDFPIFSSQSRGLINTVLRFSQAHQQRIEASGLGAVQVHALRNVNLQFRPGDRVGLVGRNGAGKSTLLRVLSGVYEPTVGHIESEGRVSALTDLMLGVDPEASGYEFVLTRGIVMGLTRSQARELIPDIETFTELGDYLHLPIRAYSSGMLLRLAFAVATARAPDILLMDEMIGVGDAQFMAKAQQRLETMMSKVQILVLASHNDHILRTFCNKAVLLSEGRVTHEGAVEDVLGMHFKPESEINRD
jgi:ABC-type polysaccharide/polyol phosphate transport system ATPase subunit